jgi:hypothetical protein
MVEYCYPECTTSVITSLAIFRKHFPDYRAVDIEYATYLLLLEDCCYSFDADEQSTPP